MNTDTRLRIALVTETYPPDVNGVATTVACVVDGLRGAGHAVDLVRPAPRDGAAPAADELFVRGLPIPRYPQLRMGLPCTRTLVERWRRTRPDVVHIATEGPLGWSALRAARRLGLPTTSDFRTNFHAYSAHYGIGWLRLPIEAWLRRFHAACGSTMVPTEALKAELEAARFEGLTVVARGVDAARFHPSRRSAALRATWGAGETTPVALYVGRLAAEKNLGTLAESFLAMQAVNPALRLVLVGDGPAAAALRARLPQAVFAGARHGADLAAHYASADIFLFPSVTETWGNVTPEAMASGLPVLAFDCAAAAELVRDGVNGYLAAPGDDEAYVRRAAWMALHAAQARGCGRAARLTAEALDWSAIVRQFELVLHTQIVTHRVSGRVAAGAGWRAPAIG